MMEEVMKLLQSHTDFATMNSDSSSSDDDHDSDISVGNLSLKSMRAPSKSPPTSDVCSDMKKTRLPTRRPDPNVYNRNALLARENRRKKKAHLANVERQLDEARKINNQLVKVLKKQIKCSRRLEREKLYYKNMLSSSSEIFTLVNALNTRLPKNENKINHIIQERTNSVSTMCSESSSYKSPYSSDLDHENTPQHSATDYNYYSDDNETYEKEQQHQPSLGLHSDAWNELLVEDFGLPTLHSDELSSDTSTPTNAESNSNIIEEHSYVNLDARAAYNVLADAKQMSSSVSNSRDTGICLHISGANVSLEFCPSCNWNASRTPPTQLLQSNCIEPVI